MKNLAKLGKALTKTEQKEITGGFWGCQAQLIDCQDNSDCPPCSFGCGVTFGNIPGSPPVVIDICAF
jgi:hypothetical protein